jgi:hypothetical protein
MPRHMSSLCEARRTARRALRGGRGAMDASQLDEREARLRRELDSAAARAGVDPGAFRAALLTVAPLLKLMPSIRAAQDRLAVARALELTLRAVALAEETLPPDSLVAAFLRLEASHTLERHGLTVELLASSDALVRTQALEAAAWRDDARLVALSRRNLAALHGRWRAGTLGAASAEEVAFFTVSHTADLHRLGLHLCLNAAYDALSKWPVAARDAAALRDVHGVACMMLEADARGELYDVPAPGTRSADSEELLIDVSALCVQLLKAAGTQTGSRAAALPAPLLRELRFTHAQTAAFLALLQRMHLEHGVCREPIRATEAGVAEVHAAMAARAAAEAARLGLRCCALPTCGAQEPAPRTYKKCSRCGGAHYCCSEHQVADWKRHKREDGCRAPAAGPA